MTFKNKIYCIMLGLVGQLFLFGPMATEPLQVGNEAFGQEIPLPASVPEKDRFTLVSFSPVVVEDEIMGALAVYDDATTERLPDDLELYDNAGHLLAFSWFDRFGIQRTSIDRGLLEEADELEGVFVVLLDGDSI